MNSDVFARLLLGASVAAALCLAGCGPSEELPQACAILRIAELPVHWHGNNVALVDVKLNGQSARMIFDTGADATLVTPEAAKRLNLSINSTFAGFAVGVGGLPIPTYPLVVPDAEIAPGVPLTGRMFTPGLSLFEKLPPAGKPESKPAPALAQPPIDGLLGREALQNFDLDIDFPNNRVVLYQARRCPSAKPELGMLTEELPRPEVAVGGALPGSLIIVELDGKPRPTIIDTGSSTSLLSHEAAAELGVSDSSLKEDRQDRSADGHGLPVFIAEHQFRAMKVGSVVTANPKIPVLLHDQINATATFGMLLGNDYLRSHRLWLSVASSRAYAVGAPLAGPAAP